MKNKQAFTLLEVIMALMFIASCMVFFLRWQSGSISLVLDSWANISRLTKIKNYFARTLYEAKSHPVQFHDREKKIDYAFTINDVSGSSSIGEYSTLLKRVEASASWEGRSAQKVEQLSLIWLLSPNNKKEGS